MTVNIKKTQFINNKYIGLFNVQFSKRKIFNYLNSRDIIPSSPKEIEIFLLPRSSHQDKRTTHQNIQK